MKKLYFGILMLSSFTWASAQINTIVNFEGSTALPSGWTESGGAAVSNVNTCGGNSLRDNLYGTSATGTFSSPSFTSSNGKEIVVSFDYKVINFTGASTPPGTATPAGWGSSTLQYTIDGGTTWVDLLVINDSNHVVSTSCATKTATIPAGTVPTGTSVQMRFNHVRLAGDWYIYLDNISIQQAFSAETVDWGNLQWPPNGTANVGAAFDAYGQVYKAGVTEPAGQGAGINAWVGYSTSNTDPSTWSNWIPATYNAAGPSNNNDEYSANIGGAIAAPGTYYYATRYNYNGGAYYYGGYNATGGGAWDGTNNVNGVLSVLAPVGFACNNPIQISSLPYSTSDNTSNYGDYIDGTPGATGCGSTSNYLNGNDVFYSYTPTSDGAIDVTMTPGGTWSGIFVYTSCSNIGTGCVAGVANSGSTPRVITAMPVTAGTTYYFVISTWAAPQTVSYQLQISQHVMGVSNGVKASNVEIYPNPTSDVLNVKGMTPASVKVFAMDGKAVPVAFDGSIINMHKLPAGAYIVQITDKEGNTVSKRIVKK